MVNSHRRGCAEKCVGSTHKLPIYSEDSDVLGYFPSRCSDVVALAAETTKNPGRGFLPIVEVHLPAGGPPP